MPSKKKKAAGKSKPKSKAVAKSSDGEVLSVDDVFKLADLYFRQPNILYSHQHNSYNKFLDFDIHHLLEQGDNTFFEKLGKEQSVRYKFEYTNIAIKPPLIDKESDELMFPSDARTRNMTYAVNVVATVTQIQEITDYATDEVRRSVIGHPEHEVVVATVPVMVRSKYCSLNIKKGYDKSECGYDPGGYFIINGSEKVVMALEKMAENYPLVFTKKDSSVITYNVQVNSRSQTNPSHAQILSIRMKRDGTMMLRVPILKEVPLFVVFRALGIEKEKNIIDYVVHDASDTKMANLAKQSLDDVVDDFGEKILTREAAIDYLVNKMKVTRKYTETDKDLKQRQKKKHLEDQLLNNFIPHIEGGLSEKAYYLGFMTHRLLDTVLERRKKDDRDSYINKRIDLTGVLMAELFKQLYRKMMSECNKYFNQRYNNDDKNPHNIINQIKPNVIEQGLKTALLTGAWGKRKGVAQMLQRLSYLYTMSSLRRVNSPTLDASTNKLTNPRHLHPTQVPMLCVVETPEGVKVGLVKNLSLIGNITVMRESQIHIIKGILKDHIEDLRDMKPIEFKEKTKVMLNGEWLGMVSDAETLYRKLKGDKLGGIIEQTVGIIFDRYTRELRINCDGGRLFRPVLRVENNRMLLQREHLDMIALEDVLDSVKISRWNEFLMKNPTLVEYLDAEEACYAMICEDRHTLENEYQRMQESIEHLKKVTDFSTVFNRYDELTFKRYTHCEIHQSLILGVVASNIPFCNHNQGPRNIFQYSQARQAMGVYITNYRDRLDISYILHHPQRPILNTRTSKYVNTDKLPAGENAIVAIACYTGYNQEDSVIMNKSAVDRGLFHSSSLKKYMAVIQKNQSTAQDDVFMNPDPEQVSGMRHGSYDKLNEQGFAEKETKLVNGDVLIGVMSPLPASGDSKKLYQDKSEMYKSHVSGRVDRVYSDITNHEGYPVIKMRIRSLRIPHVGDKMCCYDPETFVLTETGWVLFKDLTMEHKVASLQNGKRLAFVRPTQLQEYDYEGQMYKVESNHIDLLVTPNHRMYVGDRAGKKFGTRTAEEVYGKRLKYMKNVAETEFDHEEEPDIFTFDGTKDLPDLEVELDSWLIFFGIWIAEGCKMRNWGLSFATHKQRVKDELERICPILKFQIRKHKDKVGDEVRNAWCFNDKRLVQYFSTLKMNNALNKYLPDWCLDLNRRQSRLLIDGMMLGDGHTMKNGTRRYDTSSTQLADDFQRLCLNAGYSCNKIVKYKAGHVAVGKTKTITSTVDAYRLTIIESQNTPMVNKNIQRNGTGRLDEWVNDYKGKVYCCTVPGDGVIYVRRNGKPCWSGNSRHGQKGTIGITLPAADMPFTKHGLQPDIIMNPNAIPSRMTVGQLIECLVGKVSAIRGHETDGTPFNDIRVESIKDELEKLGFERNGREFLYNGMTGRKMNTEIFIGPTYYQRLKHMVSDKIHSRARGPVTLLTHQPLEGRSRDGGLRFGEMERDCVIAHGVSSFLHERMMYTADAHRVFVCDDCGLFAQRKKTPNSTFREGPNDVYWCPACKNSTRVSKVMIPYAFKLLLQEFMAMSIAPRIGVRKNKFHL